MGFYIVAIGLIVACWYGFAKRLMNRYLLSFIAISSAFLYHFVGLMVASAMHSQGAAFVTAYCSISILINGLLMFVVTVIISLVGMRKSKELSR
ncbi:hypothetical protein [Guptibacillus algicola]|uniref:hypothetical protein n=1 Tax=Guptibacillus algicola TaxID=225844 RepID=UPI001CD4DBE9|nr:hypothetical protein [Alkalihalobacillus algicola]MCA0987407.1 hypothetical protein [Alkalihalobacillus algicola]